MSKKIKNITTYIIGSIMMLLSVYMFYKQYPLSNCVIVFVLGLLTSVSYTKLSKTLLKYLPKFNIPR